MREIRKNLSLLFVILLLSSCVNKYFYPEEENIENANSALLPLLVESKDLQKESFDPKTGLLRQENNCGSIDQKCEERAFRVLVGNYNGQYMLVKHIISKYSKPLLDKSDLYLQMKDAKNNSLAETLNIDGSEVKVACVDIKDGFRRCLLESRHGYLLSQLIIESNISEDVLILASGILEKITIKINQAVEDGI